MLRFRQINNIAHIATSLMKVSKNAYSVGSLLHAIQEKMKKVQGE